MDMKKLYRILWSALGGVIGAFIGSNTALVAPVRVGADTLIGAGSVITKDVPDGEMGIARGRQKNLPRRA